jgi:ABC-2 type transport system ATP-binding protein
VLAGVDLSLAAGTIAEVTGGNGSGKSTLLRVVAGLTQPTKGEVRGRPAAVTYAPDRMPARLRMSARAYLRHMAALRGLDAEPHHLMLDRLQITPGPDAAIETLSKGNRQKVLLAQALAPAAELVLLDEPSSGLDRAARAVLREVLEERRAAGAAVLLTTHVAVEGPRPDSLLELVGGVLRPRVPAPALPMVRIELNRVDGDGRVVDVPRDESDAVLATALAEGWSVVSVRPLP